MKKQPIHIPFLGYSMILFIFILLCFVSFSTLSLTAAQSDHKKTAQYAEQTSAYYECSNKAEEWVAQIDSILWRAYLRPNETENFTKTAAFLLTDEEESYIIKGEKLFLQKTFSCGKHQDLFVELVVTIPTRKNQPLYQITSWKLQKE
ncbi:MAG: hypothetical protein ACI4HI_05765 [Lachnospiraceae bacterium]